ncbi:hypothetical protein AJ80_01293 [Polytolypa hystricis UAMH7299]|uniref:glutamate--tRNA ligase n=1 Tax=Polytolypa hystricis (strain UAMH7299) TaxID=1447883 RepID=A0A2B7YZJ2_POLH7|nr:hypothetical protein AJ80_01293 [Polytolypa hystricis UAMH7299]
MGPSSLTTLYKIVSERISMCFKQVLEWVTRSLDLTPSDFKAVDRPLTELEHHLTLRSYIVGYSMGLADMVVWGATSGNKKGVAGSAAGASYDIGLDMECIVIRFPPEPSGYLHIGHAKAALLNDYFAHKQAGGMLLYRFDDTNPSKGNAEFQDAILHDLGLLGTTPEKVTYSSDNFQLMYELCVKLISSGDAYADDTDKDTMNNERREGIASKHRDMSAEDSLAHFEEMKLGSSGWCIRAKISVDNPNKELRDPVIYRYYIEGVTYALRTNEYRDRNPQYIWIQKALGLLEVTFWDFSRMNFVRTVLSKRKLGVLVEKGAVWGWDDPRMSTIRGIRRRGMTIPALREFVLKQGLSRNVVNLDWTSLWATNKKFIDPIAPRFTAVLKENMVVATVGGGITAVADDKPKHPKNSSLSTKRVVYSSNICFDQVDPASFMENEEITLMNWGNTFVRQISQIRSPLGWRCPEKKATWLSQDQTLVPVELLDFDHIITKEKLEKDNDILPFINWKSEFRSHAWADCNIAELVEDDIIQFERKGYCRVDRAFREGLPAVLFSIPTGKTS